jgi:hypothetical protein
VKVPFSPSLGNDVWKFLFILMALLFDNLVGYRVSLWKWCSFQDLKELIQCVPELSCRTTKLFWLLKFLPLWKLVGHLLVPWNFATFLFVHYLIHCLVLQCTL